MTRDLSPKRERGRGGGPNREGRLPNGTGQDEAQLTPLRAGGGGESCLIAGKVVNN